jgi:hypothetical protein
MTLIILYNVAILLSLSGACAARRRFRGRQTFAIHRWLLHRHGATQRPLSLTNHWKRPLRPNTDAAEGRKQRRKVGTGARVSERERILVSSTPWGLTWYRFLLMRATSLRLFRGRQNSSHTPLPSSSAQSLFVARILYHFLSPCGCGFCDRTSTTSCGVCVSPGCWVVCFCIPLGKIWCWGLHSCSSIWRYCQLRLNLSFGYVFRENVTTLKWVGRWVVFLFSIPPVGCAWSGCGHGSYYLQIPSRSAVKFVPSPTV